MFTATLLLASSIGAPPAFTVENKTAPSFTVENKTQPKAKGCPCGGCPCESGKPCNCGFYCSCPDCPDLKVQYKGKTLHVSPDGTVNELCSDGVYRAVPGAPKQKPQVPPAVQQGGCANGRCGVPTQAAPAFAAPSPGYYFPQGACPGGRCTLPGK